MQKCRTFVLKGGLGFCPNGSFKNHSGIGIDTLALNLEKPSRSVRRKGLRMLNNRIIRFIPWMRIVRGSRSYCRHLPRMREIAHRDCFIRIIFKQSIYLGTEFVMQPNLLLRFPPAILFSNISNHARPLGIGGFYDTYFYKRVLFQGGTHESKRFQE